MRLGSHVSVAVVEAHSCGSNSTPSLGTSICTDAALKKNNNNNNNNKLFYLHDPASLKTNNLGELPPTPTPARLSVSFHFSAQFWSFLRLGWASVHGLILSKPKQCEGYILLIILRFHAHLAMWRLETDTNVFREFQLQKKKKKKKKKKEEWETKAMVLWFQQKPEYFPRALR